MKNILHKITNCLSLEALSRQREIVVRYENKIKFL